ncbi:MAG TPA: hypothetical protein VK701_02015 [Solirubrobacteraceae bacterium]|nr:hypothetical protein [Solirubrobacteraceae bacterium]
MIASVHLADVGKRVVLGLSPSKLELAKVPGMRYAEITIAAPLSAHLLPRPNLGRVGLIAAWDDDHALDDFLAGHPLAEQLAHGWRVRLQPTRIFGAWPGLAGLLDHEQPMDEDEPAAVLTIGRLRLSHAIRFLRASAAAERRAVSNQALLASTGLARPPALVSTFSLWQSTASMRAYAQGTDHPEHHVAVRAHAARPFHHESAFVRFRPYASEGKWDGSDPLQVARSLAPEAASG